MTNRNAVVLLLLFFAFGRSAPSARPGTSAPAGQAWLHPGVYWYCAAASDANPLLDWFTANAGLARLVKLLGSNGADCAIVLFEVSTVDVLWTLPGVPMLAPNGLDTTLEQLRPEPSLADFFKRLAKQSIEAIRALDARLQQVIDMVMGRSAP